jgi:hypothetical protein
VRRLLVLIPHVLFESLTIDDAGPKELELGFQVFPRACGRVIGYLRTTTLLGTCIRQATVETCKAARAAPAVRNTARPRQLPQAAVCERRPHSIEVSSANLPRVRCFAKNSMQTLIFGKAAARAAVAAHTFATSL